MRGAVGAFGALSLVLFLVACGGGGGRLPSSTAARGPAGLKRCSSAYHSFSIAYPKNWHVASYRRLHVLGKGDAYRKGFFQNVVCLNFDPRPFTVHEGTEGPMTAVTIFRLESPREFRQVIRESFKPRYVRTIQRRSVIVAGHRAIRYHVYLRRGAPMRDRSHAYGYVINFGGKGGLVLEAWRYGFKPIPWSQYRSNMALVDRMAPTVQVVRHA